MKETNYKLQNYLLKIDAQRKDALESRDALKYYNLCQEMGVQPEAEDLFEQGFLEKRLLKC